MRGGFEVFAVLCLVSESLGKQGFGPGEQEWGYVKVRPYANMFWWLYYTTANVNSYYDRPLLIWLQGGPGGSSTAFGNFEELGPLDTNLSPRNYTWVKNYNVLFIDNPVGTGYSYVDKPSAYTKTNKQIADDLLTCMKEFYKQLPKFRNVPTYILTGGYGGKMGAEFALVWDRAQKAGTIKSYLKGVELGDAWISPIDSVMTWAPFLLQTGMVDTQGYEAINAAAQQTKKLVESGLWNRATQLWGYTKSVIDNKTHGIDFYNILNPQSYSYFAQKRSFSLEPESIYQSFVNDKTDDLDKLMNGPVRKALGVNFTHGSQSNAVFTNLNGDFMKPVVDIVDQLLNETSLNVFVLTGHLDLIVDTPGTLLWVEKLKWKGANAWKNSPRHPLVSQSKVIEGYSKSQGNFGMYWVNRAGHMVPKDNPDAMDVVLENLSSNAKC